MHRKIPAVFLLAFLLVAIVSCATASTTIPSGEKTIMVVEYPNNISRIFSSHYEAFLDTGLYLELDCLLTTGERALFIVELEKTIENAHLAGFVFKVGQGKDFKLIKKSVCSE